MTKKFDQIKYNENVVALWAFGMALLLLFSIVVLTLYGLGFLDNLILFLDSKLNGMF